MEAIEKFKNRAAELQQEIKNLLLEVRAYLDETENESLFEAESDLYDASEYLEDFVESCQAELESPGTP